MPALQNDGLPIPEWEMGLGSDCKKFLTPLSGNTWTCKAKGSA